MCGEHLDYFNTRTHLANSNIDNVGDWGCIVLNLEAIVDLVLLAFNFTPRRSHHSQTLLRSQLWDCNCNSKSWDCTKAIKVESSV